MKQSICYGYGTVKIPYSCGERAVLIAPIGGSRIPIQILNRSQNGEIAWIRMPAGNVEMVPSTTLEPMEPEEETC